MNAVEIDTATVLVVDDTPLMLEILTKYLKQKDYEVLTASKGDIALKLAEETQPDLILLDIMMPGLDGFQVCQRLKQNALTKDIPVIFTTALTDVESKIEGFNMGAVDYITKPFNGREITARVATHLTIRKLHQQLEAEVVERRKVEKKLRQYMAELQARNEELDAFAHTVAHDLKNPLGAINGIAEILVSEYTTQLPENLQEALQAIARSSRKAVNIVEELLVLASVSNYNVKLAPLDMASIVVEAQHRLTDMIADNEAQIVAPAHWPVALGYAPWIEEVWANYLSNAIKYGGNPPQIMLGATPQADNTIKFWVKDNGAGLNPEAQDRLFMPFTRLNELETQGHGLGLSIVRRIVDKLGGEVYIESKDIPGEGCTFGFTLSAAAKSSL